MSLTRWASLLLLRALSLRNEEYIGMGIPWYFIYNASNFPLYDIKFLEMCFEKIEEQYSICDLIGAVYINFSSCLGRYEVIPRSP